VSAGAAHGASSGPARDTRRRARERAVQMLYLWEVGGAPLSDVETILQAMGEERVDDAVDDQRAFVRQLTDGVASQLSTIDPLVAEAAEHWRLERMNVVDRLILRLAVYELLQDDTPSKVVINEALELARTFSGDEAVGFVNGILDAVRRRLGRA